MNPALPRGEIVIPTVYPPFTILAIFSVDPLNLESQNKAKNILMDLLSYPIKIWGKSEKGLWSEKHKNRDYNFIYMDTFLVYLFVCNVGLYTIRVKIYEW